MNTMPRLERTLWQCGFLGFIVRFLFKALWLTIRLIPDEERLWRAVRKPDQVYKDGRLKPSFFRDKSGLSCDLARFSTPEKSRMGHGLNPYPPESGLVEIRVLNVRAVGSDVAHRPITTPRRNYAHTEFTSVPDSKGLDSLVQASTFRIMHTFRPN